MSEPVWRALFPAPAVDDAFVAGVVAARDRPRRRLPLWWLFVLLVLLLVGGTLTVRMIVVVPAAARLSLVAAAPGQGSRPLGDGDVLRAGEGLVPAVAVFAPDDEHALLVAAVDDDGRLTWLSPHDGVCPQMGRGVGVSAAGAPAAVPQGTSSFAVLLLRTRTCDAALLRARTVPPGVEIVDRVVLGGVR